jgi:hypothetical protein
MFWRCLGKAVCFMGGFSIECSTILHYLMDPCTCKTGILHQLNFRAISTVVNFKIRDLFNKSKIVFNP